MRKNEHPGCSCHSCTEGKHRPGGHFIIKLINRKIRRKYKEMFKKGGEDQLIVPTPYTD